jgi:hypothetical protein
MAAFFNFLKIAVSVISLLLAILLEAKKAMEARQESNLAAA